MLAVVGVMFYVRPAKSKSLHNDRILDQAMLSGLVTELNFECRHGTFLPKSVDVFLKSFMLVKRISKWSSDSVNALFALDLCSGLRIAQPYTHTCS